MVKDKNPEKRVNTLEHAPIQRAKEKKNLTVMYPFSYYEFRFRIRHCRRVGTSPGNIMGRLKCLAVSNDRGIVAGHGRLWEQEAKMASARTERTKNREV